MAKKNIKIAEVIHKTKLGEFRATPTEDKGIYQIEKKYKSFDYTENWIAFGIMKRREFLDFVKANK